MGLWCSHDDTESFDNLPLNTWCHSHIAVISKRINSLYCFLFVCVPDKMTVIHLLYCHHFTKLVENIPYLKQKFYIFAYVSILSIKYVELSLHLQISTTVPSVVLYINICSVDKFTIAHLMLSFLLIYGIII